MSPRAAFGPKLRAHRERRGISLDAIAHNTKIKKALLAGLERGDVSQWPRGIFRRAYVRDYAAAIGLDPQPLVAEFVQLFPENGSPADTGPSAGTVWTPPAMRLNLAVDTRDRASRIAVRALAALIEVAAVAGVAGLVSVVGGWSLVTTVALVALIYYPIVSACTGRAEVLRDVPASCRRLSRVLVAQVHRARRRRIQLVSSRLPSMERHAVGDQQRRSAAS